MSDWYYAKDNQQMGPKNESEVKASIASGEIPADAMVWKDGMDGWIPANQVASFSFRPPPASSTSLPPEPRPFKPKPIQSNQRSPSIPGSRSTIPNAKPRHESVNSFTESIIVVFAFIFAFVGLIVFSEQWHKTNGSAQQPKDENASQSDLSHPSTPPPPSLSESQSNYIYVENREASPEEVAASKGPDNVKPDAGDIIISLPDSKRMVFRKVFLRTNPFRPKHFLMGNSHPDVGSEPMIKTSLSANLRGTFFGQDVSSNLDA